MTEPIPTAAPADLRPHPRWSRGATLTAYLILLVLAFLSIWFIDRRVDALAHDPPAAAAHDR